TRTIRAVPWSRVERRVPDDLALGPSAWHPRRARRGPQPAADSAARHTTVDAAALAGAGNAPRTTPVSSRVACLAAPGAEPAECPPRAHGRLCRCCAATRPLPR